MSKQQEALRLALEALEFYDQQGIGRIPGDKAITAIRKALAEQPAQQEPVAKPYAYEYGRDNGDGTYSVVIEKGDLVQTAPAVYNYVRPRNAHKDWPIKELFDRPPASKPLTDEHCTWKQQDDIHMPDTWEADCGAMWTFTEGGPKDNDMHYCPKCGKPAIEAAHGIKGDA